MIYRSNLRCPDLTPHFKHLTCRTMGHSMGHDVLSDFADYPADDPVFGLYKNCGFWTHDEAAILYNVALRLGGYRSSNWLDIGAHTGWTFLHLAACATVAAVTALEPMTRLQGFLDRFEENTESHFGVLEKLSYQRSEEFFDGNGDIPQFSGVVIDGDHDKPWPLHDAVHSSMHLETPGVIMLHDLTGEPVQEAALWLMDHGFKCRVYYTPHMVACCYRGDFEPPVHVRDSAINWDAVKRSMARFPFERCV